MDTDILIYRSLFVSIYDFISLFAFLAAVCLTLETENKTLQEDFRKRPYLVEPGVAVYNSAAPQVTLQLLLSAILLFPSYFYLIKVFKGETVSTEESQKP